MRMLRVAAWVAVAALGALAFGTIALARGETIGAAWIVVAGLCSYAVAYRFYARFLAYRVMKLDAARATPAERFDDGRDFVPTPRWVLYGHHFSAISGAGPLIGPTLAAQFGFLPGTLWLIAGVIFGGAVQDFVILCASMRRNGKSLGEMAREEIGPIAGAGATAAIFAIMIILLAVLGLAVVNALRESPWGLFTIAATIPIALCMGVWMTVVRPGHVAEATIGGILLMLAALVGGQWVSQHPAWADVFRWSGTSLAWSVMVYGFAASVLPVWLLLTPRDYLCAFLKVGTVIVFATAILVVLPPLRMPALTPFVNGGGPVFAGHWFPFAFITIACGAISGFHALIASGTTPKMLRRETDAILVGYGGMLTESAVGLMALIAAATLEPGVYFAMNVGPAALGTTAASAAEAIGKWGFTVSPDQLTALAAQMGETSLLSRTGGAPSLAVGLAGLLSSLFSPGAVAIWYHFAIMFEALFILTALDAGTRVGRFMLQEMLGRVWAPFARTSWTPGIVLASGAIVGGWGYFMYQGVLDPLGGINSLWPLFGIANQLLAAIALCVGTTIIIKMGRARLAWVTVAPLAWLSVATLMAAWQKVFSPEPALGLLAHAATLAGSAAPNAARLAFNDRLNAGFALFFMAVVVAVIAASLREWTLLALRRKAPAVTETPFVPSRLIPDSQA